MRKHACYGDVEQEKTSPVVLEKYLDLYKWVS
jgi:hypothetical protein